MSFLQAKEILKQSRRDHLGIAGLMEEMEDCLTNPRCQSIVKLVQKQQCEMARYLKDYLDSSSKGVLNAWFQNMPAMVAPIELLEDVSDSISSDDLEALMHKVYARFSERYLMVAQLSESQQVRETFAQIAKLGVHESEQFQWQAMEYHDI